MTARQRAAHALLAGLLLFATSALYQVREWFIQVIYVPGAGGAKAPALSTTDVPSPGLDPVARVRVVLIDGLGAYDVARLSHYAGVCQHNEWTMDMGFPTISLPIQHVLWTGLTQQQTGVEYFNRLIEPPPVSIPGQVADSLAIAESHQFIAQSLGFSQVAPSAPRAVPEGWNLKASWRSWLSGEPADGFERAARAAVASDARLVFVHILRVDTIAHMTGIRSPEYQAALAWADRVLGDLIAADAARDRATATRWFVLADHGHLPEGGHGGQEENIRQVKLCLQDGGITRLPSGYIHLVDASRAIADSLGVALAPGSAGRPLRAALAGPAQAGATLPTPGTLRWLLALALLALALGVAIWAAGRHWWCLPWWLPAAYLSLYWRVGEPTLSTVWVRKPGGALIYDASLPALLLLAAFAGYATARVGAVRATLAQLAVPLAALAGMFILCWGTPPLMPRWTAHTSAFLVFSYGATFVMAISCALAALARTHGLGAPSSPR